MFLVLLPLREAALPCCCQSLTLKSFDQLVGMAMLCQGWNRWLCCLDALGKAESYLPVLALRTDYVVAFHPSVPCRYA